VPAIGRGRYRVNRAAMALERLHARTPAYFDYRLRSNPCRLSLAKLFAYYRVNGAEDKS
jgi:hypothetical protein